MEESGSTEPGVGDVNEPEPNVEKPAEPFSYPVYVIQLAIEEASRQAGEPWYALGKHLDSRIADGGVYSATTVEDGQIRVNFREHSSMAEPVSWYFPRLLKGVRFFADFQ